MRKALMPVQQPFIAPIFITLAALGAACERGVLHTGAAAPTVVPSKPVPIHETVQETCDAGADACGTQGPTPGGTCDPGLVACPGPGAGYCFDLQASPEHCGTCDHACALGSPCENGQCRVFPCTTQMSTRSVPVQGLVLGHYGLAPTDCDRDGTLDLLAFGNGIGANQSKSVGVLRGNGDGTFGSGERYPLDTPHWSGYSLQVADLNRDQIADLIIMIPLSDVTTSPDAKLCKVIVRLGKGDCTFGPEIALDAGAGLSNFIIGDLDGDQNPDLVASASERVTSFHGNGDGSFSNRQDFVVGGSPRQMAVTDWNSDGIPDVVASDGDLHLLLGTGGGHLAPAIDCALAFAAWNGADEPLVFADFDGDGVVDLASSGIVLLGMHECNFTRQVTYADRSYPIPLATGDFNGDGTIDLLVSSGSEVGFVPGDGHGNFGAVVMLGVLGEDGVGWPGAGTHVGDFNGDGRLDFLATGGSDAHTLINTCQ